MFSNSNHHNNHRFKSCHCKRIFLTLIFINTFLGCIYYFNEQNNRGNINSSTWKRVVHHEEYVLPSMKNQNAIQSIQDTLANEYNHDDLNRFYAHVQNEYALGLKCTRQENILESNTTDDVPTDMRSTMAQNSSLSTNQFHSFRTNFNQYIIDHSNKCSNQSIDLLIIIISKPENYQTRDAIRRTWLSRKARQINSSIKIKYFFLLDFNEQLTHNIERENDLFEDIIQVDLPEQYTLVTYRVISVFEWSFRFCRTAKFLFKTDDDIFVNFILLLKFVSPLIQQPINDSFHISDMKIYGYQHIQAHVFRQAQDIVLSRYVITMEEYPCPKYPTFLSGYGYLISKKARDAILYASYQDPEPFRISDVYLTGIIPQYLSIPQQSMSNYRISNGHCEKFFQHPTAFACASSSHHGISSDIFRNYYRYWQAIENKRQKI